MRRRFPAVPSSAVPCDPRQLALLAPPGSPEAEILAGLDLARLPRHVAIIMDGNGRWASRRGRPRVFGHRAGVEAVRAVVEAAGRLDLEVLTLFAFSRENWKRPRAEIDTLMRLLEEFLEREVARLREQGIRLRPIGRLADLPERTRAALERARVATEAGAGLTFNIALSYGGRAEIVDACRALVADGVPSEAITEETFAARLTTAGQPDPDLLVRTSGEMRVSNFLLWQIAYAELHVTPTLWPDFRALDLLRAVADFQRRERRYGGV